MMMMMMLMTSTLLIATFESHIAAVNTQQQRYNRALNQLAPILPLLVICVYTQ